MLTFPNAKINIGLNVIEKRSAGFHNIVTLFYPVGLSDALEIIENSKSELSFSFSGLPLDFTNNDKNLVSKAFLLLKKDFDLPFLDIHLHKAIPLGAGLGGGSSDASFMLKALNEFFNLGLDEVKLIGYARILGSDCSFFIKNSPAFGFEKGDSLIGANMNLNDFSIVIVYPGIKVNTREAYSIVKPAKPAISITRLVRKPVLEWRGIIENDFEEGIFKKYPLIGQIKKKLYALGAMYASMSGSGSSVYGIFENTSNICGEDFPDCFFWKSNR